MMEEQVKAVGAFLRRHLNLVILAVGVIAVGLGAYKFIASRPANVVDAVRPTFKGYNGDGTLTYNETAARKQIFQVLLAKNGISKQDAEAISNDHIPSKFSTDIDLANKLEDTKTQLDSIDIEFSKTEGLANGDHVKLHLKATADLPINSATKDFKVSGLKKTTTYTAKAAMGKATPVYQGVNGFGEIKYSKRRESRFVGNSAAESATLKNGDKVTYTILSDYREGQRAHGRRLKGNRKLTYTVSGLPEMQTLTDWKKLMATTQNSAVAANQTTEYDEYKIEPVVMLAVLTPAADLEESGFSATPAAVDDAPDDAMFLRYVTIFKVTTHYPKLNDTPDDVRYVGYGREGLPVYDGKVHAENIDDLKFGLSSASSEKDAVASFKDHYAHAVEVNFK